MSVLASADGGPYPTKVSAEASKANPLLSSVCLTMWHRPNTRTGRQEESALLRVDEATELALDLLAAVEEVLVEEDLSLGQHAKPWIDRLAAHASAWQSSLAFEAVRS